MNQKPEMSGELRIRVNVFETEDGMLSHIEIGAPPDTPELVWMLATEHLMKVAAQKSGLGHEKALEVLAEAATEVVHGGTNYGYGPSNN